LPPRQSCEQREPTDQPCFHTKPSLRIGLHVAITQLAYIGERRRRSSKPRSAWLCRQTSHEALFFGRSGFSS
jgi:hypothetical protein